MLRVSILFSLAILIAPAANAQAQRRPIAAPAPLYSISLSDKAPNWTAAMPDTKIRATRNGLEVQGARSQSGYQLVSAHMEVTPGKAYAVDYDVQVTSGGMTIGVLDAVTNQWITVMSIVGRTGRVAFEPTNSRVQIILANNNDSDKASSAMVRKLSVLPTR